MRRKFIKFLTICSAVAVVGVSAVAFAGCTTKHPTVTITYTFNEKDYKVDYTLSRVDAPKTVQHFIELADAGYYNGLCIHDYDADSAMTCGGYKIVDDQLVDVDYFSKMKELENGGKKFTKSVWDLNGNPLYNVYGEFENNGVVRENGAENSHKAGALVMYYETKGNFDGEVTVKRVDNGEEQTAKYKTNCATSLFYTYLGSSGYSLDSSYCVFGMAKDYDGQLKDGLLAAIEEYIEDLGEDESFTEEVETLVNKNEPNETVRNDGIKETFHVPMKKPIVIKSVKVTKY